MIGHLTEQAFQKLLRDLQDYCLIVEGKRDQRALNSLGLKNIKPINSTPLFEVVEDLRKDMVTHVVILTDFDRAGRRIEAGLLPLLQMSGIHVNQRLRGMVAGMGKRQIEDLANGLYLGGDVHGEIGTYINQVRHPRQDQGKGHR